MGKTLPTRFDRAARDARAAACWPHGMGFSATDEDLLSRGWPHLAVLVDRHPDDRDPATSAWQVISAIDPVYAVRWPRETARRYLHAFASGSGGQRESYEAGLACEDPVTVELADAIIARSENNTGRYPFHHRQALFLLEDALGPEVLGDRIVSRIERLSEASWRYDNMHNRFIECLFALECCLLRCDSAATAQALWDRAYRAYERRPPEMKLSAKALRLALTLADEHDAETTWYGPYNLPFITDSEALVRARLQHEYAAWLVDPQHLRLFGPDIVPERVFGALAKDPAWKQQTDVEVYGLIDHPVAVRWMLSRVGSRAAKRLPELWLLEHLALARPLIEQLRDQGSRHAAILEAILSGDVKAVKKAKSAKPLSAKEVRDGVKAIFGALVEALAGSGGDEAVEKAAVTQAVTDLIQLKAAAGDPIPEAHIGHALALDGWGKLPPPFDQVDATQERRDRWYDWVVEAT